MRISEQIRAKAAEMPPTLWLDAKCRGIMTGAVTKAVKRVAEKLRVPLSNGRAIRLRLASIIYERTITTFNDLSHAEIWALNHWATRRDAIGLEDWLRANFEHQIPFGGDK